MALTDASTAAERPRRHALDDMPARRIAALIAARDLSSTEAVDHFLSRLGAVNGKLNAVVVDLADSARQTAAKVDAALSRGEKLGPLAGVPVTDQGMFRSGRYGVDVRPRLAPRRNRKQGRSPRGGAADGRRDPDRQDQSPAAHDLHRNRQSALRTHEQSVGCGKVVRRLERRRGRGHRRRRLAARPRQRHRRLVARPRGVLRNSLDPTDRGPHTRLLRSWLADRPDRDCQSGRPDGQARRRLDHGIARTRPRSRPVCRSRTGIGRPGRRRSRPAALCDIHR